MAALHPKFLPSSFCSNQISIGSISPASNPLRNGAFSRKNSSSVAYTPLCLRSKLANPSMADSFHSIEHVLHSLIPGPKIQNPKPTSFASNSPNLNWNPLQKLAALALDKIEKDFIPKLEGQTLPSTADPRVQLEGNFAPVPEMSVHHKLEIEGTLPACLEGLYLRNGANPRFEPTAGHHFFDGDGMLHAVQFKDGVASYCCRYTQTHRLMEEEKIGRAIFPKAIGELHGHGGAARLMVFCARNLFGLVDGSKGMGPANAGVIFFDGHVLAMSEDDQPYAVKVLENGDLQTLGRYDFNGQLGASMIAHPKKDPKTGELFALSYDVVKKPYLKYFYFSKEGVKGPDVEITLNEPTMMHDFAITENYAVIPDQQLVFRLEKMLKGGSPVERDAGKTSRFGVLPKYAKDEKDLKWIDVPDCFCFHVWNAWEENEEEIVVLGSCMTPADCVFNESQEEMNSILCEIRLNLKTGTSTRNKIAGLNLEAGQVNRQYLGRKARFLYLAVAGPWPKICGIAKIDMEKGGEDRVVCTKIHGDGCYGGEPFFVPRSTDPSAAEDDGYVLSFVHNEKTGESKLVVLDAKSPDLAMVASIKLPGRVPYGFHGTFVTPDELMNQKQSL